MLGRAKGDDPKVTEPNLRKSSVFCENLRFSVKICGFLQFPAPSKCWNFQEKGWICKNLRLSAKMCVLGALCHLSSVTLSSAWTAVNPLQFHACISYMAEGGNHRMLAWYTFTSPRNNSRQRSTCSEHVICIRYFWNPCDCDHPTGNFKNFKFFQTIP